jgi:hypothetical protein
MQLPQFLDDALAWQTWVIPAAGLFASLLALIVGHHFLSRSHKPVKEEPGDSPRGPTHHDPFDDGSVSERRGAARRKGNPVEVFITDAEATREPVRACVVDRSVGGLCLLVSEEVEPGTVLSVKPRNAPPATPWIQVEVRACKKDRAGYEVGCQFVHTPPWPVMLLFG